LLLPFYSKDGISYTLIDNLQKMSILDIQKRVGQLQTQPPSSSLQELVSKATVGLSYVGEAGAMTLNPPVMGEMICHASIG
jgi:hypothetical protein